MARDLPIGNGNLLINFDADYNIRDVYYPHVGQENHTLGDRSRFGIWCDDKFNWIDNPLWQKKLDYDDDSVVTHVVATNAPLGLEMTISDTVDFDRDVFIRRVDMRNQRDVPRQLRLYLHFDPHLWGNTIGDTVFFDPDYQSLVAYKGRRYVLMSASVDDNFGFSSWAIGAKERENVEGTWRDAEDGKLGRNPIAQGSVDAIGMVEMTLPPSAVKTAWFWWGFGKSFHDVTSIDSLVRERGAAALMNRTRDYWRLWATKNALDVSGLPENIQRLYRRSLLIMRTHVDNTGAVIAASDSDIIQFGRDTYTYMWPRDGAIVTLALQQAGYQEITRRFFEFCSNLVTSEGFLLHKYNPDGSAGSSWHPWMTPDGKRQLPIQEDETALVVWALWEHFRMERDVEFVRPLYKPLVKVTADFMARYREPFTRLPAPSYDLWEERRGISAYTVAAVWAGLTAAAKFTDAFGEVTLSEKYSTAAAEIREAAERSMFDRERGRFCRMINVSREGEIAVDHTIDASLAGLWLFGMFDVDDPRIVATMDQVIARLTIKTPIGGLSRYEGDGYFQASKDVENVPGNPWIVCTLTIAQWYAARAKEEADLQKAIDVLQWAVQRARLSGVLAEQVDPYTGAPLSVAPLTWSHAAFVLAAHHITDRMNALSRKPRSGVERRHVEAVR